MPIPTKRHPYLSAMTRAGAVIESCPKCGSRDIRGPYDGPRTKITREFKRAWYCRSCWWDTEQILIDDVTPIAPEPKGAQR